MYRIKQDKRSLRSAQLIYQGLLDCLEEKEFSHISISDIQRKSYVSRSTFYRLFDTLEDVLAYQTYLIFQKARSLPESFDPKQRNLFFIETWIQHHRLLETIVKANLPHILYQEHQVYFQENDSDYDDNHYLSRTLSSIMISTLITWIETRRKETAQQLYSKMIKGLEEIQELLTRE